MRTGEKRYALPELDVSWNPGKQRESEPEAKPTKTFNQRTAPTATTAAVPGAAAAAIVATATPATIPTRHY